MKKNIIILFLSISFISAKSQDITKLKHFFYNINHNGMQTDFLWNYGFVINYDVEQWYNGIPIMSSLSKWSFIYNSIKESNINGTSQLPPDSLLYNFNTETSVALSILLFKGDYLPENQVEQLFVYNNGTPEYKELTIFSGTTLNQNLQSKTIKFVFQPELLFSNIEDEIATLSIDFGDGKGYTIFNKNKSFEYKAKYNCSGEKNISFQVITSENDTLISYSRIKIAQDFIIKPDYVGNISAEDTLDFELFEEVNQKPDPNIFLYYANYLYIEGDDGILDKPIIFVEGFDILGDLTLSNLEIMINNALDIETLTNKGYDVFIINLQAPDFSLNTNAGFIKTFIKRVNESKIDKFESILIGFSMGGVISRIALKQLENENYVHHVGLFVSFDSPHKGGNIPMGLQYLAEDVNSRLLNFPYLTGVIVDFYEEIFGIDIPFIDIFQMLESYSSKQMLVYHHNANNLYSQTQTYLQELGQPQSSRNVSCVSGSNTADEQDISQQHGTTPPDHILTFENIYGVDVMYGKPEQNTLLTYTYIKLFGNNTLENKYFFNYGIYDFDVAPGGNLGHGLYNNFTFIPTISTLDINDDIWNTGDLLYYNENSVLNNSDYLIENNLTSFDDIYSDDANSFHCSFTTHNLYNDLKEHEIMYDEMFLQNRVITNSVDFEASQNITTGNDISSSLTSVNHQKHIDNNNFKVQSNGNVRLIAGEKIVLSSGTEIKYGAEFTTIIDPSLKNKRKKQEQLFFPNILGHSICRDSATFTTNLPSNIQKKWHISGINTNITSFEDKIQLKNLSNGQYSVYCYAIFADTIIGNSKVIKFYNTNNPFKQTNSLSFADKKAPQIYPNPAKETITIILNEFNPQITIYQINGEIVLQKNITSKIPIDISFLEQGIYILTIKTQNNVWNSKIIKI